MPPIFKDIAKVEDVDLRRHALIEASAGTGKTYTLARLVIRLLKENADLDLGNILLVTFTEKAAGELKERVRQLCVAAMDASAQKENPAARRFETMMTTFDDEAAIYTIHGFCHRLLRDYAFENQALFNSDMVADASMVASLVKTAMRAQWPRRHGRHLPEMMQLAGLSNGRRGLEAKIGRVLQKSPRPEVGDIILPPIDHDYLELRKQFMEAAHQLDGLLNGATPFVEQYEQLNFNKRSRAAVIKNILAPLAHWAQSPDPVALTSIVLYQKIKDEAAGAITPRWLKAGDNSGAVCPTLFEVKATLERLLTRHQQMTHYLVVTSVAPLQKALKTAKARNGLISYDDMIEQVHAALYGVHGTAFTDAIRRRFQVALVDEFQDTDPLQWRIFRKLFLKGSSQRLFLIGDPKQAIYGFRGADVYTYLAAKKELVHLAGQKKAALYTLTTNYRSSRELIVVYNQLFAQPNWFGEDLTADNAISYNKVRYPLDGKAADNPSGAALHLLDLNAAQTPTGAYPPMAAFIAREIQTLISGQPFPIQEKGAKAPRPIQWSDIAILVRRKKGPETVFLERALLDHEIPFSYYKKPGLFQSKEAYFLAMVMRAVATPHDRGAMRRALLTPFFGLTSKEVVAPQFSAVMEKARRHLMQWGALAHKRQWGAFFEALVTTAGFTFRASKKPFWERCITNCRQLFELLMKEAINANLDLEGLVTWLEQMRTKGSPSGDEEVHRIETERPKVQIMTIHTAKGLEFPVVFVAGGLTRGRPATLKTYHRLKGFKSYQVFDLTGKSDPDQIKKERLTEEKNLYYVAMTRARQRLYFPFKKGKQTTGPVGGFIATAIANAFGDESQNVTWRRPDEFDRAIEISRLPKETPQFPGWASIPRPLFPERRTYFKRVIQLASFSSLQQKASDPNGGRQPFWWDLSSREDDEPTPWKKEPMVADELPGGKSMGSCLHLILEKIDYAAVVKDHRALAPDTPSGRVVDRAMGAFGVDSVWRSAVCEIVTATLTAPIRLGDLKITLGDLPEKERLHEAAFMFTRAEKKALAPTRGFRGVIDLVFRQNNRYFVVDFKSNRLTDYGPEALERSILKDGYERQYRIYAVAIYRWLSQLTSKRESPPVFGGVFYLYLRGITEEGTTGIYFVPPEKVGCLEKIEQQIWPWFNRESFNDA